MKKNIVSPKFNQMNLLKNYKFHVFDKIKPNIIALHIVGIILLATSCRPEESSNNNSSNATDGTISCTITSNYTIKKGVYTVNCDIQVQSPATLTIEPGTIINFNQSTGITINSGANITALGTSDLPIIFQGTQQTKGYWGGIVIKSKSLLNKFTYCTISDGGDPSYSGGKYGANVTMLVGTASFSHCKISNSSQVGFYLNGGNALDYSGMDATQFNLFEYNSITSNGTFPIISRPAGVNNLGSGNLWTGNAQDYIAIRDQSLSDGVNTSVTYTPQNVPYLFASLENGDNGAIFKSSLTIAPGTTIVFGSGTGILCEATGSINAVGTSLQPIIFKGLQPTGGYWGSIYLQSNNPKNDIEYCQISDGGGLCNLETNGDKRGMISGYMYIPIQNSMIVKNCNLSNSGSSGIYLKSMFTGPGPDIVPTYNSDISTINTFNGCSPNIQF